MAVNVQNSERSACSRGRNIALAGPQYISFAPAKETKAPYRLNTRVYSCILVNNGLPFEKYKWRGRYNEDTDLSIRVLKDGWVTVLSNAFLVDKTTTMRNTGGNTTELYDGDGNAATRNTDTEGRKQMTESLRINHPDIVKVVRKFGRWHHSVNYKGFKTALLKVNPTAREIVSEYGLERETQVENEDGGRRMTRDGDSARGGREISALLGSLGPGKTSAIKWEVIAITGQD